jgi:surface carbohydrate biosynthesis protein
MSYNLYIEVEVFKRDFESRFFLALEAAHKGFDVYLAHRNQIVFDSLSKKFKPGIIHRKDANSSPNEIKIYKKLKELGFIITAMDEETGIIFDDFEIFYKLRFSKGESLKYIDNFFCWGPKDFDFFVNKFPNIKNKFINSGCPRVDMCKPYFIKNQIGKYKQKNNIKKKYILFASNIGCVLALKNFPDRIEQQLIGNDSTVAPFLEQYEYENEVKSIQLGYEFVKLIRYLSDKLKDKDIDIVIRPHPNEIHEDWLKLLGKINDNVFLINKGTLKDSISDAEVIIQHGCTSAIKSFIMEKPLISFVPISFKKRDHYDIPNNLGVKIETKEEVLDYILSGEYKKQDKNLRIKKSQELEKSLNNIYDSHAYEVIISQWINLRKKLISESNFYYEKRLSTIKFKNYIKKIIKKLFYNPKKQDVFNRKFPEFDKDFVLDKKNYYSNIFNNRYDDININFIESRLISLKKK